VIRDDDFMFSRGPYAISLATVQVSYSESGRHVHFTARAMWYRGRKAEPKACLGYLANWIEAPACVTSPAELLKAAWDGRYGGRCEARWDGRAYWSSVPDPGLQQRHLALLRPMIDGYPVIPDGYDGWWRYPTTAEIKELRSGS
jgi:hypothetical protein